MPLLLLELLLFQYGATTFTHGVILTIMKAKQYKYGLPELCFKLCESGPLAGIIRPTFGHQAVKGGWALRGHSQSLAVLYPANHIVVLHALERLDAVHQDLPHAHAYRQRRTGELLRDRRFKGNREDEHL